MTTELLNLSKNAIDIIAESARESYPDAKKRRTNSELVKHLIEVKHFSPFEQVDIRVRIVGMSRTGEAHLIRHRHCSFNIQSARKKALKQTQFHNYVIPARYLHPNKQKALQDLRTAICAGIKAYESAIECGIPPEDARFGLVQGEKKTILMKCNLRQARWIIETRGHKSAQWEIRQVAIDLYKILNDHCPEVVGDFTLHEFNDEPEWEHGLKNHITRNLNWKESHDLDLEMKP